MREPMSVTVGVCGRVDTEDRHFQERSPLDWDFETAYNETTHGP